MAAHTKAYGLDSERAPLRAKPLRSERIDSAERLRRAALLDKAIGDLAGDPAWTNGAIALRLGCTEGYVRQLRAGLRVVRLGQLLKLGAVGAVLIVELGLGGSR